MSPPSQVRICFVCLGNICRSPTAEGVMRHVVARAGVADRFLIDSAGTDTYHVGESPDDRATHAATLRGIRLVHKAQAFGRSDFARFDHVFAMDLKNLATLRNLAPNGDEQKKIVLFRSFDDTAEPDAEVPDPYYGGAKGFETVLDICERAASGLLVHLRAVHRI